MGERGGGGGEVWQLIDIYMRMIEGRKEGDEGGEERGIGAIN